MPVMAFRGSSIADSAIPLATGFIRSTVESSDLFLFRGDTAVPSSVVLEIPSFEVSKSAKLGQLNVLDFSNISADGFVKVNDFVVGIWKGSKKLKDVFGILLQFLSLMWECTEDGRGSGIPSDSPVSVGLNGFRRFPASN